jgi:protoporphyrinogen oxidase
MGTFREWVLRNFGSGFGKHFFFPYNEKLWAVSPDVLTDDWTGKFVPRPSLEDVVLGAFYDLKKGYGYNVSFLYPRRGGIQALTDAFTEKVKNLRFGTRVGAVDWKRRRIETDSCEYTYENLISTIPMAELLGILKDPPAEIVEVRNKLKWNSILCMNLGFSRAGIGGDLHWIYFPEKKFPFYRVGFYHNFSPCLVPEGASSMYIEISRPGGTLPEAGKLFPAALRGLAGAGLIRRGEKPEVVNIIPVEYAYVIYDKNRSAAVKAALGFLEKHGIFSIGRYGAWKYSYIEESITDGLKTALRINHGRNKKS